MRSSRHTSLLVAAVVAFVLGAPLSASARQQQLNLRVSVTLVPGTGSKLHYHGTFTGAPFGSGTTDVTTTISGSGSAHLTFALTTRQGSVRGNADANVTYRGNKAICSGTARITSGTGAYSRYRASKLDISGTTSATADTSTLNLSGTVTS